MAVTPTQQIVDRAFIGRYGVPAVNVFNDASMEAVLQAAVNVSSPLIVQTSVKTVRSIGARELFAMWSAMTAAIPVPVALHLDHCPDRAVLSECLRTGWNSVLFDASELPVEENQRQTKEVVAEAREFGAAVEGEIEAITGVEDDHGSDDEGARQSLAVSLAFIQDTEIDIFAPSIGNAHGSYKSTPKLDFQRVSDLVAAHPIPIALHGGSGLTDAQFQDLIARGCAKVNISTALKETFMKSSLASLQQAQEKDKWDPPTLFREINVEMVALIESLMTTFGSAGKVLYGSDGQRRG